MNHFQGLLRVTLVEKENPAATAETIILFSWNIFLKEFAMPELYHWMYESSPSNPIL